MSSHFVESQVGYTVSIRQDGAHVALYRSRIGLPVVFVMACFAIASSLYAEGHKLKLGQEYPPAGEGEVIQQLVALQSGITKAQNPGRRGQHAKPHGCVEAEFHVLPNIPEELRVGAFREARRFEALVRFSNGGKVDDQLPDVHGMAIKLLNVDGPRAWDGDGTNDQDFVLIDSEVFFSQDARTVLGLMVALTRQDPQAFADFASLSPANRRAVGLFKQAPKPGPLSPLAIPYWSAVPYRCGGKAVKYSVTPGPENAPLAPEAPSPGYLRTAMVRHLTESGRCATFDFFIQVQTNSEEMPVEDPTIPWSADQIKVAKIVIQPQYFTSTRHQKRCEETFFTPWHALDVHRPLGGINRARKEVYKASAKLRMGLASPKNAEY